MTLDNRPTRISVKKIPQEAAEEELRHHFEVIENSCVGQKSTDSLLLQQFGHILSFDKKESELLVQYGQRFEAEKAMSLGSQFPKGALELEWSSNVTTTNESS